MPKLRVLALASLCVFLSLSELVAAQPVPSTRPSIFVDSDSYTSHADQSADLIGHVKIIRGDEQLTCDRAHINPANNEVSAEGNVILISPQDYIKASKMVYNFSSKTGIVYNGFIQTGQETIEGDEIYKIGDQEYQATNGTYTSCVNCPPSWKLSGSKIKADVGNYAYIKNPTIRFYGIPIFWLPYIAIPIKTQRQSGLLPPFYGVGATDGTTIGDSYFWAINRSQDATLTETHYSNRGFKTGLEYRFITDKDSSGFFQGNFINDMAYGHDPHYYSPDVRYVPDGHPVSNDIDRYSIRYQHHFVLPDDFVSNVNVNTTSDTSYPLDFPNEMPGAGDPALENRVNLTKNTENSHASVDVDLYQNLLKADPVGQNGDAVQRVPEFIYNLMPTPLLGTHLLGELDVDYTDFARALTPYDETNGTPGFQPYPFVTAGGVSEPADRYRTGQRLIIHPELSYPINIGDFLDLVPDIAYEADLYEFGYSPLPEASRNYLRTSLSARTRLSSVFGDETAPTHHKYKHEIIPEINYTYVPYLYQENHPFLLGPLAQSGSFGGTYFPHYTSNQPVTEFDNLQFDYKDRLVDLNMITFGLTNVLIQKQVTGNNGVNYRQILRHSLTQSYDFYTAYGPPEAPTSSGQLVPVVKQPWSEVHSLLNLDLGSFMVNSDVSYYPYVNAAANSTSAVFRDSLGNALALGYAQSFSPLINPTTGLIESQANIATESEAVFASGFLESKYLDFAGTVNYDVIAQAVTSYSLYSLVKLPGKCWGISVTFTQVLGGQPSYRFDLPIFFGEGKNFSVTRPPGL